MKVRNGEFLAWAEVHGWLHISDYGKDYHVYLTPTGKVVTVVLGEDGLSRVHLPVLGLERCELREELPKPS